MTRYETPRTDVVDRIVAAVAREAYVDTLDPADREERARVYDAADSTVMRHVMGNLVRPNVEYTLAALRSIAYAPDGFCLLDGPAQATVQLERLRGSTTWDADAKRTVDLGIPAESPSWYGIDSDIAQGVVDMVLDRLALLPVDPRPR